MKNARYFFFVMAVVIIVFFVVSSATADPHPHDEGGGSTVDVVSTLTGGDTTIGDTLIGGDSSKALGLGFSYALGDVDLNEGRNCYVSIAKGNIIFGRQEVALNPWCASLFYDANRKHEFAAKLRCGLEDIAAEYSNKNECVLDQTLSSGEIVSSPVVEALMAKLQEFEEEREVLVEEVQQQLDQQQAQYEQLAARRSRVRVVQQAAPEPQPYLSQELAEQLRVKK